MPTFLSIIIPAHNEEKRLPQTLPKVINFLQQQPYEAEVLVVENGSSDCTAQITREFSENYPIIRLLQEPNAGKGLAVRRGMLEAKGQFRFVCDADLSMPIEDVKKFLPPAIEYYDLAIASREAPGAVRFGEPLLRHWIGRIFNLLVRLFAVPGFMDTQCGFKCFRGSVAEELFHIQKLDGWTFDVEILFLALRRGYRVIEIPIHWYYSPASRIRVVQDSIHMLMDLFRIRTNWRKGLYVRKDNRTSSTEPFP